MTMPELVCRVGDCSALSDAGVIDENVGFAKTLSQIAEHACDAFGVGNVADERDGVVADLIRDLLHLFGGSRMRSATTSFACKGKRDGASDAAAAAGDQR